ncbi:dehydrogenase [Thermococcus sp. M39]|uniref:outer membrane protein assembly factor BamB family protein n=1 Tax=unclassified Thermococcus TaxID=2627626 RepID=UPI00143A071A|nr:MULTISPECIES: PQQ-binding-like beta-propeller repeat protein [unclassified Thermococcus]NJE08863.1 dehydrogenase [Thermococcus sp. M39]NJE13524.1 dehydrogenase [Thermococcus sp. LS2]
MGKLKYILAVFTITFLLIAPLTVRGESNIILWKGQVCENVPYQKSIESVDIANSTIYVGCGYIENIKGVLWYRGNITAFSLEGQKLWSESVGFVRKIQKVQDGIIVGVDISRGPSDWFGTLGKIWLLQNNGSLVSGNITYGSFFDFQIVDNEIYISDGWWIGEGKANETWGRVYKWKVLGDKFVEEWYVELNGTIGRVRVGNGIIYAGSGAPSGYRMKYYFGDVYGISPEGKILWKVHTGWWIRDMEVWNDYVIVGTGFENVAGKLYLIDNKGNVVWSTDLYYVEDIEVENNVAYVAGIQGSEGKVTAIDLASKKKLWEVSFPYRAKVVKYYNNKLLIGTGKFDIKQENNQSVVYNVGSLYIVDSKTGNILEKIDTGYVRSIALSGNIAVIGTGGKDFYVIDLSKIKEKSTLNQQALMVIVAVIVIATGIAAYTSRRKHAEK